MYSCLEKRRKSMNGGGNMNQSRIYSQKLEEIAARGPIFSSPKYESQKKERPVVLIAGPYGTVLVA